MPNGASTVTNDAFDHGRRREREEDYNHFGGGALSLPLRRRGSWVCHAPISRGGGLGGGRAQERGGATRAPWTYRFNFKLRSNPASYQTLRNAHLHTHTPQKIFLPASKSNALRAVDAYLK
eukprot:scaffold26910_cov34-Tisochrysis_lutea.AAC.2